MKSTFTELLVPCMNIFPNISKNVSFPLSKFLSFLFFFFSISQLVFIFIHFSIPNTFQSFLKYILDYIFSPWRYIPAYNHS